MSNGGSSIVVKKELYQTFFPGKEIDNDEVDSLFNKINSNIIEILSYIELEKKEDPENQKFSKKEVPKIEFTISHGVFTRKGYELSDYEKTM